MSTSRLLCTHFYVAALLTGCGWKAGRPPVGALSAGPVTGATIEPALRAALRGQLAEALARRGVPRGGDPVEVTLVEDGHTPELVVPASGTTGAYEAALRVRFAVPSRPGCVVEVAARRSWALPASAPDGVGAAREEAMTTMARELAQRGVDGLLSVPACGGEGS